MADETCVDERVSVLLARHGGVTTSRIRDALAALGYSPRQGTTLLRLAASPGGIAQQTLAETLCVDASVLVGILNDLEAAELLIRRRDPADRRRHIVAITAKGERAAADVQSVLAGVEQDLFADLNPTEVTQLHHLLSRVRTRPDDASCAE